MTSLTDNIKNIKKIYMSDSSLNILLDFERVLDNLDLFVFPNWTYGELVEGPIIAKYWVKCKFMWPYNLMPDPDGAKRLIPYGAKVTYEKDTIRVPVKINSPDDYRDGSKKGKLVDAKVWYVEIMMPKSLMSEIKQGSIEIAGEEIDLNELQGAYEKDLDQKALTTNAADMAAAPMAGGMSPEMGIPGMTATPPIPGVGGLPNV